MRSTTVQTIYGHVSSAGVQTSGNVGFSIQKTGTGVYIVNAPAKYRVLQVNASTDSGGGAIVDVDSLTGSGATLRTYLSSTGAAGDWGFHVIMLVNA